MTKDEIRDSILAYLSSNNTDPNEAITAVAHVLIELLCSTCHVNGWGEDVITASSDLIRQIQENFQKIANDHKPESDDGEYVTLDEIRKRTAEDSEKLTDREADIKARAKACEQIMETDTLGFLLLSYMKDGNTSMCTNLKDEKMRNEVFFLLKETLFGKGGERSYSIK